LVLIEACRSSWNVHWGVFLTSRKSITAGECIPCTCLHDEMTVFLSVGARTGFLDSDCFTCA